MATALTTTGMSLLFTLIPMETASAYLQGRARTLGNPMLCVRANDMRVCVHAHSHACF